MFVQEVGQDVFRERNSDLVLTVSLKRTLGFWIFCILAYYKEGELSMTAEEHFK